MTRLRLPEATLSNAQQAKEFLRSRGISLPERPNSDALRLPDSLDGLSPGGVTEEMLKWSRMLAYIKAELSLCEIRHNQAKDMYDKRRQIEFMRLRADNPRATVKDLYATIDTMDRFARLSNKVEVLDAKRRLMQSVHDGQDQAYKLLSRELTRRTSGIGDRGLET